METEIKPEEGLQVMRGYIKRELKFGEYGKYYSVRVYCTNCGEHDAIYVLMGRTKPKTVGCVKCGCNTAKT